MKTLKKFQKLSLTKKQANRLKGGNEMARETNINRSKSASKIHNKMVQTIMS